MPFAISSWLACCQVPVFPFASIRMVLTTSAPFSLNFLSHGATAFCSIGAASSLNVSASMPQSFRDFAARCLDRSLRGLNALIEILDLRDDFAMLRLDSALDHGIAMHRGNARYLRRHLHDRHGKCGVHGFGIDGNLVSLSLRFAPEPIAHFGAEHRTD